MWHSAPAYYPTGYGVQTANFVSRMMDDGHEVVVLTTTQQPGITWNGIHHVPGGGAKYGSDGLLEWPKRVKTDIMFGLFDIWVLPEDIGKQIQALGTAWAPITPIDHDPIPPDILKRLRGAKYPIAMSLHGFREMQRNGLTNATYVPHGVDTQIFRPHQPNKAMFKTTDDTFVVGVVATNVEPLDRKGWYPTLAAFGRFHAKHPDSIVYVHATAGKEDGGFDLIQMADLFNFKLRVPDMWTMTAGIPVLKMVELYNSFDVMLLLTRGEGFGVPLIEAQACGTPVITTDFTAPSDLVGAGWKVPSIGTRYTPLGSFWAEPDIDAGVAALEEAYGLWKDGRLRDQMRPRCREFVKQYDADFVYKTYMRPFLERVEEDIESRKSHCEEHGHRWSGWATKRDGVGETACMDPNCTFGAVTSKDDLFIVPKLFPLEFNGVELRLEDDPVGCVVKSVIRELGPSYGLDTMTLKSGDVVVDIGAHVGTVSIYSAKKWPGVRVYSYEPNRENFERLQRNIEKTGVCVAAHNLAVTGDGREITLFGDNNKNSGACSIYGEGQEQAVASTTLADIFQDNDIERCALLKIDCEGAEYEVLYGAGDLLDRVDRLSVELHLMGNGYPKEWAPEALLEFCSKHIKPGNIRYVIVNTGDDNGTQTTQGDDGVRQEAIHNLPVARVHSGEQRPKGGNGRGGGRKRHSSGSGGGNDIRQVPGDGVEGKVQERSEHYGDREAVGEVS